MSPRLEFMETVCSETEQLLVYSSTLPSSTIPIKGTITFPSFTILDKSSLPKRFERPECYIHSVLPAKLNIKYMLLNDDIEFYYNKLNTLVPFNSFEFLIDTWEKMTGLGSALSKEQAMKLKRNMNQEGVEVAYEYWISKRQLLGHALLRNLWMGVEKTDENLKKVFCRRKIEKRNLRSVRGRTIEEKTKVNHT